MIFQTPKTTLSRIMDVVYVLLPIYTLIVLWGGEAPDFINGKPYWLWPTIAILIILFVAISIVKYTQRDLWNRPPYEVKDGKFYVHRGAGNIDEYSLEQFNGKVVVIKKWSSYDYLEITSATKSHYGYYGKIEVPLSLVGKKERQRLIQYLKDTVETGSP